MVSSGFAERKKKQLLPTENGIKLIAVLPERVKSPVLTAEWENALTLIARGELAADSFMQDISSMTTELVKQNNSPNPEYATLFGQRSDAAVIGSCPRCGGNVVEGKKNFYCHNKDCKFTMWKEDKFFTSKKKKLTQQMASTLLKSGKIGVKGLYSEKNGKTYDATVVLADTGDKYVNYQLEFEN